ncbi:MAG: hypothetical protein IT357_00215 [Gemmatimonadaceae bacterium]|nr:hypothetical protein [Gemmatimonadaceae bacterium]
MSDVTLRPRSVTELVDATFTLYRRDAGAYIMVTAIASVPALILNIVLLGGGQDPTQIDFTSIFLVSIVSLVSWAFMNAVLTVLGAGVYLGDSPDVAAAVRKAIPHIGTLVGVAFVRGLLYFIGFLMVLVGLPYFFCMTFAYESAVVIENRGLGAGFDRTRVLSKGLKWHIFKTLFLGYFIYFLLVMGGLALQQLVGEGYLGIVLSQMVSVIAYPIVGLLTMLLYYDTRIRKEGFDVEHLARSLEPSAGTAFP